MKLHDLSKDSLILERLFENSHIEFTTLSNLRNPIKWNKAYINSNELQDKGLFIGLQGAQRNGGEFLSQAIEHGAVCAIIERGYEINIQLDSFRHEVCIYIVEDSLHALVSIAKTIRAIVRDSYTFIGLTGSAGKTSSKNILYHLLVSFRGAVCSQGNLNTVQGMSLCILNTDWRQGSFGVFECGISQFGEMEELVDILDPDYALVTNVSHAHIGGYKNIDQLRREKLSIAKKISPEGVLWLPEDDTALLETAQDMKFSCSIRTHGIRSTQGLISSLDKGIDGILLNINGTEMSLPLIGRVNISNALLGIEVARYFGMQLDDIATNLNRIENVEGRYHILMRTPLVIDDSYNANPDAILKAMKWLSELDSEHKILVLGGMRELGEMEQELHLHVLEESFQYKFELVVLVGMEYNHFEISYDNYVQVARNDSLQRKNIVDMVRTQLVSHNNESSVVFFKGSRYYELNTIAYLLVEQLKKVV